MKARIAAALLAVVAVAGVPGAAPAATAVLDDHVAGEILVRFDDGAPAHLKSAALGLVRGELIASIPQIGWDHISVGVPVDRALRALAGAAGVRAAEPNYTGQIASGTPLTPDDRCYRGCAGVARQWNVDAVNARLGWAAVPGSFYTATTKGAAAHVKVAVLDTKIDAAMADWGNRSPTPLDDPWDSRNGGQLDMVNKADFVDQWAWTGPAYYHGTFVAGIVGAAAHNGTDVAGLGYEATIMPVTVVDGTGQADAAAVAQGIVHAADRGARVINMSFGLNGASGPVQDAIYFADEKGALSIAAAGNNANDRPFYPAANQLVMAVSATDEADRPGKCSNFGSHISVAAPGVGIVSLDPTSLDRVSVAPCGTSTAAPHVSALAALLFAQDPSRSPDDVREIIEATADDDRFFPGHDVRYGAGRINFERALRAGDEPEVWSVRSTFPRNIGGTSAVTALGRATSPTVVAGAEYFLDEPGAPGTGTPLAALDGAFDEPSEDLTATIPVGLNVSTGVHRLFIRATDGTRWGPASVGVLIVDRTRPVIENFIVGSLGVTATGQGVSVSFKASDDYSPTASYQISVVRDLDDAVVYTSPRTTITIPSSVQTAWLPELTDVGPHEVRLTVWDEGENPARASAPTLVL